MGAMDSRPVGVFDSGVGGLTVLHECLVTMPNEDFVYLGDHARLPYGSRPLAEIRRFAREIGAHLEQQDVKLILVACNAATSAALPRLQEELTVPVVGVITPEAHAAVQATRSRRVGLLATAATVEGGRYGELVHALDAGISFHQVACPRLVPTVSSRPATPRRSASSAAASSSCRCARSSTSRWQRSRRQSRERARGRPAARSAARDRVRAGLSREPARLGRDHAGTDKGAL